MKKITLKEIRAEYLKLGNPPPDRAPTHINFRCLGEFELKGDGLGIQPKTDPKPNPPKGSKQ